MRWLRRHHLPRSLQQFLQCQAQALLNSARGLSLSVDGQFGPMTAAAVKQWQTANGLVPDGLVGPMTKAAMNAVAPAAPSAPVAPAVPSMPSASASQFSPRP